MPCVFWEKTWGRPLRFYRAHYSSSELEVNELNRAETLWICSIQDQSFEKDKIFAGKLWSG